MRDESQDRRFDAALAKYADVEHRGGLEQRVLANLRMERERVTRWQWGRWPALAALVLAIAVAVTVRYWRSGTNVMLTSSVQLSSSGRIVSAKDKGDSTFLANTLEEQQQLGQTPRRTLITLMRGKELPEAAGKSAPKPEQFPSPEALTEQEKLLVRYVNENRKEAELTSEVVALMQRADKWDDRASSSAAHSSQDEW